jgi:hypothetical protein
LIPTLIAMLPPQFYENRSHNNLGIAQFLMLAGEKSQQQITRG